MKPFILTIVILFSCFSFSQKVDWKNAPRNPIAFKYKREHFDHPNGVFAIGTSIFDTNGNLISEDLFGNGYSHKCYIYENGRPIIDSDGQVYTYNSNGYLVEKTYANSGAHKISYTYNNLGLLIASKTTQGYSYEYVYDNKNRLIKSIIGGTTREYSYKTNGDELYVVEKDLSKPDKIIETKYTYKNGELIGWNDKPFKSNIPYVFYKDILNKKNEFSVVYTKNNFSFSPLNDCKFYLNNQQIKFLFAKVINKTDIMIYNPIEKKYFIISNVFSEEKNNQKQVFTQVLFHTNSYIDYSEKFSVVNYQGVNVQDAIYLKLASLKSIALENLAVVYDRTLNKSWYGYKADPNVKNNLVPAIELETKDHIVGIRSDTRYTILKKGYQIDIKNTTYGFNNEDVIILLDNQPTYYIPNYRKAKPNEAFAGRLYNSKTDKILEYNNTLVFRNSQNSSQTQTSLQPQSTTSNGTNFTCESGDCNNGYGKKTAGKNFIEGFFTNSKLNGYGYQTSDNGFSQGEFKDGELNGFGFTYYNLTKEFFIGQWRNGKQNGYGYYKVGSTITEAGYYQDGKLVTNYMTPDFKNLVSRGSCSGNCVNGFGFYKYSNGDSFTGFFYNSSPAYMGTYHWSTGDWYLGNWVNGKRTGQGRLYFSGPKTNYLGNFENDKMEGLGIYINEKETITQKGTWENGVLKSSTSTNYKPNTNYISDATASAKPISNFAKETARIFNTDASQNKSNFKKHLIEQENKWKNEGKTTEQIGDAYAAVFKELYDNDMKDYAFEIMMKNSNLYNSSILPKLSPEQRLFVKTKAREFTSKYSTTK